MHSETKFWPTITFLAFNNFGKITVFIKIGFSNALCDHFDRGILEKKFWGPFFQKNDGV